MSQLQYLINLLQGGLIAGLRNAVVKRTAELKDEPDRRAVVVSTILKASIAVSLVMALLVAMGSGWLAREVLQYGADAEVLEPAGLREFMSGVVAGS